MRSAIDKMDPIRVLTTLTRSRSQIIQYLWHEDNKAGAREFQVLIEQRWWNWPLDLKREFTIKMLKTLEPYPLIIKWLNYDIDQLDYWRNEIIPRVEEYVLDSGILGGVNASISTNIALAAFEPDDFIIGTRFVKIQPGGVGGAKSIKLGNINSNFINWVSIGAGGLMTVADMAATPHPLVISAGILLIIASIIEGSTRIIGERTASVFWGMVTANKKKKINDSSVPLSLPSIQKYVNHERKKVGLNKLSPKEIKIGLDELCQIKALKWLSGKNAWLINERLFKIQRHA